MPKGLDRNDMMCRIAAEYGYEMAGKAIPMIKKLFKSADLIIVMTEHPRNEMTRLLKYNNWNLIVCFNDYCCGETTNLTGPTLSDRICISHSFATIERSCAEIIKKLKS